MRRPSVESVGEKFGLLTVTKIYDPTAPATVDASCECGGVWRGNLNRLRSGNTKSCGCQANVLVDLSGRRFGAWLVTGLWQSRHQENGHQFPTMWECLCDCGQVRRVQAGALVNGQSRSCGCVARERSKAACTKHGMTGTDVYWIWQGIKARVFKPTSKDFPRYGARGIDLFVGWVDDFEAFYTYVGPRPSKDHSIERLNNDLGYVPGNVIWATRQEQANNNRGNRQITIDGVTKTMVNWCRELNLNYQTVSQRISNCGWDSLRALSTPTPRPYC